MEHAIRSQFVLSRALRTSSSRTIYAAYYPAYVSQLIPDTSGFQSLLFHPNRLRVKVGSKTQIRVSRKRQGADIHSVRNRYPTPGSVTIRRGLMASGSS